MKYWDFPITQDSCLLRGTCFNDQRWAFRDKPSIPVVARAVMCADNCVWPDCSLFPLLMNSGKKTKKKKPAGIYKLTLNATNSFANNAIFFFCTRHQGTQRGQSYSSEAALATAFLRSDGETAGVVRSLNQMGISTQRKSACEADMSIHCNPPFVFTWGRSWVSDLRQIPGGSPLSAYFTVHVSKSWYIWQTSPKPKRHNLPALKWWCGQSRAGAGWGEVGGSRDSRTAAGDDTIHQRGRRLSEREWVFVMNE